MRKHIATASAGSLLTPMVSRERQNLENFRDGDRGRALTKINLHRFINEVFMAGTNNFAFTV